MVLIDIPCSLARLTGRYRTDTIWKDGFKSSMSLIRSTASPIITHAIFCAMVINGQTDGLPACTAKL